VKRGTFWEGYKVHLTQTYEPDSPNLITQVAATDSTVQDVGWSPRSTPTSPSAASCPTCTWSTE
jgi:hypothetical protein